VEELNDEEVIVYHTYPTCLVAPKEEDRLSEDDGEEAEGAP
jgi:hypothetical protein